MNTVTVLAIRNVERKRDKFALIASIPNRELLVKSYTILH